MPTILAIAIAEIATWLVSWATTYVVSLPISFSIGAGLSTLHGNRTSPRSGVYVSQAIGYGTGHFIDLLVGYLRLRLWAAADYFPLLLIPIAWSTISYARHRFSFATREAHVHNRWQKAMNIVGSTAAAVVFLIVASQW